MVSRYTADPQYASSDRECGAGRATFDQPGAPADQQLDVSADAVLFGPDSRLDSLGLLALVIDIEDGLRGWGGTSWN